MKLAGLIVLAFLVSSCDSKGNYLPALSNGGTTGGSGSSNYAACMTAPTGATSQMGCPTTAGLWDNYEVITDSNGAVTSSKLYCNGTDQDHPTNQAGYDALFAGSTSASDFKIGSDCASGTHITVGLETVQNIWQKK